MSASVGFENIPAELRTLKRWVNWDWETNEKGEPTKVPKQPNGRNASSTNPKTWSTFDAVYAAACNGHFTGGLGFVFEKDGGFAGLDFDECRNPDTGETEQWVLDEIAKLDSYTEVSPSNTGWKVLVKGKLPAKGNKKY